MKNNKTLQKEVQNAIMWEPSLKGSDIGVTAEDGIITLTGTVATYSEKIEAEDAAKRISGVKAVVEKIKIQVDHTWNKSDDELAKDILTIFKGNVDIPNDKIKIKVENGWVTLEGELPWRYQKVVAKTSLHNLIGVKGISNDLIIKSLANDKIEKTKIENAIARNWSLNGDDIRIEVTGNKVILSGAVESWYDRTEAERITWNAPGVWEVFNELVIENDY